MTDGGAPALEQALALHRWPRRAEETRGLRLPADVGLLLRVAAGEREALAAGVAATGEPEPLLREAAVFYIQQVLFDPRADSFRVLGANPDASDEELKANHRRLVRWLHPDRNPGRWESVFVDRVNAAWNDVRNAQRRQDYGRRDAADTGDAGPAPRSPLAPREAAYCAGDDPALLPTRVVRRLPAIVLGVLALVAVSVLGLLYQARVEADAEVALAPAVDDTLADADPQTLAQLDRLATATEGPLPSTPAPVAVAAPLDAPEVPSPVFPPPVALAASDEAANAPTPPSITWPGEVVAAPAPAPAPDPMRQPGRSAPAASQPVAATLAPSLPPPRDAQVAVAAAHPASAPPASVPARSAPGPVAVAPATAPRPPPPVVLHDPYSSRRAAAPAPTLDRATARAVVQHLSERYERGDIPGLRALFTADPDRALRRSLKEFERVIERSVYRRIEFRAGDWRLGADSASWVAPYVATVVEPGAAQGVVSHGTIHLRVQLEGGQPRIAQLRREPAGE